MNTFYFSFETKQVINPLEAITHFYVNPYMPESARMLNLQEKSKGVAGFEEHWTNTGLPVILFPINILDLKTVVVSVCDDSKFIIKKGNMRIYVKLTDEPSIVRIDTVLF